MSLRPFRFEVDNTGVNPNNLVVAEQHTLQGSGKRFLVTKQGPFYTGSLVLVDNATGQTLAPRAQYTAIQLEEEPTLESGKEVCSIIVFDDASVSNSVSVTYQAYGGWMSYSVTGILEMVQALDLNSRTIYWADIVGVPDRYPPAPHAHPLSDIYGWSKLFPVLTAIRDAILIGDQAQFDAIRASFAAEIARLEGAGGGGGDSSAALTAHVNDDNNPHNVTMSQLGGYTTAQISAILAGYLTTTGTATNSSKLEGRTFNQVQSEISTAILSGGVATGEVITGGIQFKINTSALGEIIVKLWNTTGQLSGGVSTPVTYPGGSFPTQCYGVVPVYTTLLDLGSASDNRYGCGITGVTKDGFNLANDGLNSNFFFVAFGR